MGIIAATRELAPGYTVTDFKAAFLEVVAATFGPYTPLGPATPTGLFSHQYLEFADWGGQKFYLSAASAQVCAITLARQHQLNAQGQFIGYLGPSGIASVNITPNNFTTPARIVGVTGAGYRLLSFMHSTTSSSTIRQMFMVCELLNPPSFWGNSKRGYVSNGGGGAATPGTNPWGSTSPDGATTVTAGETNWLLDSPTTFLINTAVSKRQILTGLSVRVNQSHIGYRPADIALAAYELLSNSQYEIMDGGDGYRYLVLFGAGQSPPGLCVRVATDPFPNLTVLPGYIYDRGYRGTDEAGSGGTNEPTNELCVYPYPSEGQAWPLLVGTPTEGATYPPEPPPPQP